MVRTAVQSSKMNDIILVEDDTDLLTLFIYLDDFQEKQVNFAHDAKAN